MRTLIVGVFLVAVLVSAPAATEPARRPFVPTVDYERRSVEGWTVYVNRRLLAEQRELGTRALRLLEVKLYDIERVVPAAACAELKKVPLWLGVDDGHAPCAEYHPSREWLEKSGYNPDKGKAVEIGNAGRFLEWSRDQPWMLLHELAHAYHDRVLGFDHPEIRAAYERAVADGRYGSVLRSSGQKERAYALTNAREYFAEGCEAYFGANDFYPFVRSELRQHDPELERLIRTLWNGT
jgi:hypothetical protein